MLPAPIVSDLSGHWEMDYGRSDNVDQKLQSMYREWRRMAERRARGDNRAGPMNVAIDSNSFRRTVDVARFADLITSSQILDIEQTDDDIAIQRENDYTLSCVFDDGEPEILIDELGSEICGWDAHQLVFRTRLPDDIDIQHRISLSDEGDRLHIATRVDGPRSPPFTINRFYFRFDPLPEDYSCEYTLSRGNVCQTGAASDPVEAAE
ncbi:MAG: hypothetical protein AAGI24_06330 [Pseudomonadota bacterium]